MDEKSDDKSKVKPPKCKKYLRKILSVFDKIAPYYVAAVPALLALWALSVLEVFEQIPGVESSLFGPSFRIGLLFVILAGVIGLLSLHSFNIKIKKLQLDIEQIKNDLYEKKSKEDFQKIIKKESEESSFKQGLNRFVKRAKTIKDKSWTYVIIAGFIVLIIGGEGHYLANQIAPPATPKQFNSDIISYIDLKNFYINSTFQNIDHEGYDLMRQSERLRYDYTIISSYPDDVLLAHSMSVSRLGKPPTTWVDNDHKVPADGRLDFTMYVTLEDSGINPITAKFEFNKENWQPGGVPLQNPRTIEDATIYLQQRVYTQSEYDYRIERHELYKWLWVAAFPIVFVGIKAFRDIFEDKGN